MTIPFDAIIFLVVCLAVEQTVKIGFVIHTVLIVLISFVLSVTLTAFLFSSTVQTNEKFHKKLDEVVQKATFDYHDHMKNENLEFSASEPNCLLYAENVNEFYHFLTNKVKFDDPNRHISTILLDAASDNEVLQKVKKVFPLLSTHHTSTTRKNLDGSAQDIPFYWLPIVRLYAERLSICQELTFKEQLDAGIRGFDIRMSVIDPNGPNNLENWVIDHNVKFQKASDFFEEIKDILQDYSFEEGFDSVLCLMIRQSRFSGKPDLLSDSPQRLVAQFFRDDNERYVKINETQACVRFYKVNDAHISIHNSYWSSYDTGQDVVLRDISLFVELNASAPSEQHPGNTSYVLQGNLVINVPELIGILLFFFVLSLVLALIFRNHMLRWIFVALGNAVFALLLVATR